MPEDTTKGDSPPNSIHKIRLVKRKTPLLAYCEYVSPDSDNSVEVSRARVQMIEAAKRVYPEFLEKLSTEVFPFYSELAGQEYNFDNILWSLSISPSDALPKESGLKSELFKWATEFNAKTAWLMDDALRTLWSWYVTPEWRESLRWNPLHSHSSTTSAGNPFKFSFSGWPTELLTWSAYSGSVRRSFEKKLSKYENSTRKLAESYGLVLGQRKYSPENLEWFVRYQFAELSVKKITTLLTENENFLDDSTVRKGIKAAAKLIAWGSLRPPPGKQDRKIG